jgi:hypothetical protein
MPSYRHGQGHGGGNRHQRHDARPHRRRAGRWPNTSKPAASIWTGRCLSARGRGHPRPDPHGAERPCHRDAAVGRGRHALGEPWAEPMGLPETGKGGRPLSEVIEADLAEFLDRAGAKVLRDDEKLDDGVRRVVRQVSMEEIGKKPEVTVVVSRLARLTGSAVRPDRVTARPATRGRARGCAPLALRRQRGFSTPFGYPRGYFHQGEAGARCTSTVNSGQVRPCGSRSRSSSPA